MTQAQREMLTQIKATVRYKDLTVNTFEFATIERAWMFINRQKDRIISVDILQEYTF